MSVREEEEADWDTIKFGMSVLKNTRTAFQRQILESVTIQRCRGQDIMNKKAEYNSYALLMLTAKL